MIEGRVGHETAAEPFHRASNPILARFQDHDSVGSSGSCHGNGPFQECDRASAKMPNVCILVWIECPVKCTLHCCTRLVCSLARSIRGSSNGRTAAFGAVNRGSNPCPRASSYFWNFPPKFSTAFPKSTGAFCRGGGGSFQCFPRMI